MQLQLLSRKVEEVTSCLVLEKRGSQAVASSPLHLLLGYGGVVSDGEEVKDLN